MVNPKRTGNAKFIYNYTKYVKKLKYADLKNNQT